MTLSPLVHHLEKSHKIQKIIWFALTGSILFYGVLPYFILSTPPESASTDETFVLLLYGVGFSLGAISYILRQRFFSDDFLKNKLREAPDLSMIAQRKNQGLDQTTLDELSALPLHDRKLLFISFWSIIPNVISWGLNDGAAALGLVLAFLTGEPDKALPLLGLGLIMNVVMFPRPRAFEERALKVIRRLPN